MENCSATEILLFSRFIYVKHDFNHRRHNRSRELQNSHHLIAIIKINRITKTTAYNIAKKIPRESTVRGGFRLIINSLTFRLFSFKNSLRRAIIRKPRKAKVQSVQ